MNFLKSLFKPVESFLNPGKAYNKAMQAYQPYYNEAQSYQKPFYQQGQAIYPQLSGAIQKLLNPAQLENEFMQSYETSPSATRAMEDAMFSGKNALSAMGMLGSSPGIRVMQEGANNILNADKLDYLRRLKEMYFQGAGAAQNLYGTGANAGNMLGQNALNMGANMGNLTYGREAAPGNALGALLGQGLGMFAPWNAAKAWSTVGNR